MRIRSTKPEFWRSKTIAQLDWGTRLVLKGLESYVDDNGVGKDDLALIASDVFPRDLSANPRETLARLSEAISTLFDHALIARYRADGEDLLYIDRWNSQQRIDKPGKGRFPRPDGTFEYQEDVNRDSYAKPRETDGSPPETHAPGTGEQGNRGTGEQEEHSSSELDVPEPLALVPPTPKRDLEKEFERFWVAYPRKEAKADAKRRFLRIVRDVDPAVLIAAAERYRARGLEHQYQAMPNTWLNQGRWEDQPPAGSGDHSNAVWNA